MLHALTDLVRTPSVSGSTEENAVQADFADLLTRQGLDIDHWRIPLVDLLEDEEFPGCEVDRSEAWGLVGRLPGRGDGPSLMLNGHIDVVPAGDLLGWDTAEPFSGRLVDGSVHGRGSCDMKGGLVAALWAVTALRRAGVPLRGDVLVASVQGEEDGGLGSFALGRRGWRADACVIPEPTGLDLVPAASGALTFRLRVSGSSTHASRRLAGVSAIEKFWPVWSALQELERARNVNVDPLMERWLLPYPISVGTLTAGIWASSVPDVLVAEGRFGVALDEPVEQARAALEEAISEACERDSWLRRHPVQVEWWGGQFAAGRLSPDSPLAAMVRAAHHTVTGGGRQQTWGAPYGSDLRLLEQVGIPTLHYGPGDAALAHSANESVPWDQVRTAARALAVLALDVCRT